VGVTLGIAIILTALAVSRIVPVPIGAFFKAIPVAISSLLIDFNQYESAAARTNALNSATPFCAFGYYMAVSFALFWRSFSGRKLFLVTGAHVVLTASVIAYAITGW